MGDFKKTINKTLGAVGYELHRSSEQRVNFNNFANLAHVYEMQLNESGSPIVSDEIRIRLLYSYKSIHICNSIFNESNNSRNKRQANPK